MAADIVNMLDKVFQRINEKLPGFTKGCKNKPINKYGGYKIF